jgi:hypothetical protein
MYVLRCAGYTSIRHVLSETDEFLLLVLAVVPHASEKVYARGARENQSRCLYHQLNLFVYSC